MTEIGAKVYQLAANSALYREINDGIEWIQPEPGKRKEFVRHEDYEKALKKILELEEMIEGLRGGVDTKESEDK